MSTDNASELSKNEGARQIIFVDPAVRDYETLLAGLSLSEGSDREVVILDAAHDGIAQITNVLAAHDNDLAGIHILSHGSSGSVTVGNTQLSADNLDRYAGALAGWQAALTADADILLYGCNVADGEWGVPTTRRALG